MKTTFNQRDMEQAEYRRMATDVSGGANYPPGIERGDIDRAFAWRAEHSKYVSMLVAKCRVAVPPSGSDVTHPEWWLDIHWRWLDTACATGEKIWR